MIKAFHHARTATSWMANIASWSFTPMDCKCAKLSFSNLNGLFSAQVSHFYLICFFEELLIFLGILIWSSTSKSPWNKALTSLLRKFLIGFSIASWWRLSTNRWIAVVFLRYMIISFAIKVKSPRRPTCTPRSRNLRWLQFSPCFAFHWTEHSLRIELGIYVQDTSTWKAGLVFEERLWLHCNWYARRPWF